MTAQITLDDFALSLWNHLKITKKTLINYKGTYRLHISPLLGDKLLGAVTRRDLLDALAPLSPHTYYQTLMSCRVIYREALNRELVDVSPVAAIKAPRLTNKPSKFLTWEEVESTNFGKYDEQIKFLALHGLRWGEAVALTKEDIYDEKVHVTKSIHGATVPFAAVLAF